MVSFLAPGALKPQVLFLLKNKKGGLRGINLNLYRHGRQEQTS